MLAVPSPTDSLFSRQMSICRKPRVGKRERMGLKDQTAHADGAAAYEPTSPNSPVMASEEHGPPFAPQRSLRGQAGALVLRNHSTIST